MRLPALFPFSQVKTLDSDKINTAYRTANFKAHTELVAQELQAVLSKPWLQAVTGEAMVLKGSGASLAEGLLDGEGRPVIVTSNDTMWRPFRATRCTKSTWLRTTNTEERIILQHLGMAWCSGAIVRYEARARSQFELVVYTRPDLIWWKPMIPWCQWSWGTELLACSGPGCDMFWVSPRRYMERLMSTAAQHRDCTTSLCCQTSERLVRYAQTTASGGPALTLAREPNGTRPQLNFGDFDSFAPISAVVKMPPPPVSLLRTVMGVCEAAFGEAFTPKNHLSKSAMSKYSTSARLGLSTSTIAQLQRVFENRSVCQAALKI